MRFQDWSVHMGDFRTRKCTLLPIGTDIDAILEMFKGQGQVCIGLVDSGRLHGVIDAESIVAAISTSSPIHELTAADLAATNLSFTTNDTSLSEFLQDMTARGSKHIVVTYNTGSIEVIQKEAHDKIMEFSKLKLEDLLPDTLPTPTIAVTDSCLNGLEILSHESNPCIAVYEKKAPVGVVTRKDITEAIERHANLWGLSIAEVTQDNIHLCAPEASAIQTIMQMENTAQEYLVCHTPSRESFVMEASQLSDALACHLPPLRAEFSNHPPRNSIQKNLSDVLIKRAISDSMNIGVIALSTNLVIQYSNATAQELLDFKHDSVSFKSLKKLEEDIPLFKAAVEAAPLLTPKTNQVVDLQTDHTFLNSYQAKLAGVWEGDIPNGFIITIQDSTDVEIAETKLRKLAYYDALTGLPNRTLLFERLASETLKSKRDCDKFSVVFADLDGFKAVNDAHGHRFGDLLLAEVGERFKKALRTSDTVARLGGDEFVFILPGTYSEKMVNIAIYKVLSSLTDPFVIEGIPITASASFGFAIYPEDGSTPEELIEYADRKMYYFKKTMKA